MTISENEFEEESDTGAVFIEEDPSAMNEESDNFSDEEKRAQMRYNREQAMKRSSGGGRKNLFSGARNLLNSEDYNPQLHKLDQNLQRQQRPRHSDT